jgi:cell division septal protein FtsQ
MTVGTIQKRRRAAAAPAKPASRSRGWLWAMLQIAVLGLEIFAILFLLAQPAFRAHLTRLSGSHHLSSEAVIRALDLPADRNIFFLNHAELQRRVEALPWVRTAAVDLELPDRVSVRVTEWQPAAVLQVGETSYYLNEQGEVLDPAAEAGKLPVVNRPDLRGVRDGQHAVNGDLLPMLLQLQFAFTSAYRVSLMSFQLDRHEVLSAQTDRGWTIVFGQMVTDADRASLEPKLAALKALTNRIDITSAPIKYINLENPGAPAVQMRAKK